MNAERLLAYYEQVAEAPDAVASLRRFILDLAVRGRLVPQDDEDEPASELLKRIAKEKLRLGAGSQPVPLKVNEVPFELPTGWSWTRIGEICSKTGSGSTPRGGKEVYKPSGVPFLRSQNVYDDGLRLHGVAYIDLAAHARMSSTRVEPGDLLLNVTGGSMGRCCLVPSDFEDANVSQHVAILRVALRGVEEFLHRLILSPYFQAFVFGEQTGAGRGGLPKNRMDSIPVALPPLAEGRRIVAKIDELMGLCGRLEVARAGREAVRDRLAAASLARLNAPETAAPRATASASSPPPKIFFRTTARAATGVPAEAGGGFADHARFVLDALPALTSRPDQIEALRKTILNLAVRGKLVPQDANDERATELLIRISRERVRSPRGTVSIESEHEPYSLPATWKWAALDELILAGPQNGISPKPTKRKDAPKAITLTATTSGTFDPRYFKHVEANIPVESDLWLRDGDFLFQRGNTREFVGMAAVYRGPRNMFLFPDLIIKVRISEHISLEYAHIASISPSAREFLSVNASGAQATMPKINQTTLVSLPIPLPPLAEQRRIVAKVGALMALCDRLEASLTATAAARRRLLDALLAEALAPAEDRALKAAE